MKKSLFFVLFSFIVFSAFSAEIELFTERVSIDKRTLRNVEYKIFFDTDEECIIIKLNPYTIYISKNNITHYRNILQKFLEWESIAIKNGVEINREIPDSNLNVVVRNYQNNNIPVNKKINFGIETIIIDRVVPIGGWYIPTITSGRNYFLTISGFGSLPHYFLSIQSLLRAISETNLEDAIREGNRLDEKQRQVDDLFR